MKNKELKKLISCGDMRFHKTTQKTKWFYYSFYIDTKIINLKKQYINCILVLIIFRKQVDNFAIDFTKL